LEEGQEELLYTQELEAQDGEDLVPALGELVLLVAELPVEMAQHRAVPVEMVDFQEVPEDFVRVNLQEEFQEQVPCVLSGEQGEVILEMPLKKN
jgi:hypothetical protein